MFSGAKCFIIAMETLAKTKSGSLRGNYISGKVCIFISIENSACSDLVFIDRLISNSLEL